MRSLLLVRTAPLIAVGCLALLWLAFGTARADKAEAPATDEMALAYRHGDVELEGWLARPSGGGMQARPGVLIVHAWRGRGDFVRDVASRMAKLGYVAFALDMYGKGVYAADNAAASKLAQPFYGDAALVRGRARAGLEVLRNLNGVDPDRVAVMGFCFGGMAALELARDGAPVAAAISFHGSLGTQAPAEEGKVAARILVCHGGDDPHVPPADVEALWKELRDARTDHQILILSGAVHSFTDPEAGADPTKGSAYSAVAARRSWDAAERLLAETFAR